MAIEILWLFIAGALGGVLNSLAGGGSFITFPALLLAGVPPVSVTIGGYETQYGSSSKISSPGLVMAASASAIAG